MKARHHLWWCPKGHQNPGYARECLECGHSKIERHAQIHSSERSVVYYNPQTGEHRTPARADTPIPDIYAQQGFERREILSMTQWERESGVVHEPTTFNSGNEVMEYKEPDPKMTSEARKILINDIRDAAASGPWTDSTGVLSSSQV